MFASWINTFENIQGIKVVKQEPGLKYETKKNNYRAHHSYIVTCKQGLIA